MMNMDQCGGLWGLTEHGLQTNQTAHKVVKVDGEIWFTVTSHQDLMERVVETETWNTQKLFTEDQRQRSQGSGHTDRFGLPDPC